MGGRGASGSTGSLSASQRSKITAGIETHTKEQNDKAQSRIEQSLQSEYDVVKNAANYIKVGKIKSTSDPWFQEHVESYKALSEQLKFMKKERKRLGR